MKYMFLSDIHGSIGRLRRALDFYTDARCDMLLLLGDIINYGPRNRIPDDIDPAAVAARLNSMRDDIVAVRGNCDSEVDQMLLKFPIMADYAVVTDGGRRIFITHGHIYNEDNMPVLRNGVFVYGHTHLWKLARREDYYTKAKHVLNVDLLDNYEKIKVSVERLREMLDI